MTALFSAFLFNTPTIYDIKTKAIEEGKEINFASFKGKKLLIVNTASNSPYTFQIDGMQQLYSAYKEKLVVIAFPCGNDFGEQELKTNKQIQELFIQSFGATFPIAEITTAKGEQRHPIFQHLITEAQNMGISDPIKGYFTKFLLDENGQLLRVFPANVTPLSSEITSLLNDNHSWKLD